MILKKGRLIGYFISDQESGFYQSPAFTLLLQQVQSRSTEVKMKEKQTRNGLRLVLTIEKVNTIDQALQKLNKLQ